MANLFSNQLGVTIEKFYICHKIERVKELLIYQEQTLTDIAFKLHYSSVAHYVAITCGIILARLACMIFPHNDLDGLFIQGQ